MTIKNIRAHINWFKNNKDLIYADSAATSLKPNMVTDTIINYYEQQSSNPHNNDSMFAYKAQEKMEQSRTMVANLVNVSKDEIIFTSGATEGLSLIAQSMEQILKEGDEIILTRLEHASNLLPWYHLRDKLKIKIVFVDQVKLVPRPEEFIKKINKRTKLISFTGMSNLIGVSLDVKKICDAIKKNNPNIYLCLDATQMIPHQKCDFKKFGLDFGVFSAHKLFGPTGIGALYIKKQLQNIVNPIRFGGGMNFSINEQSFCYIEGVAKYEGGTPHVAGIYGWVKAIEFLNKIGYNFIEKYENKIHDLLVKELSKCNHLEIYNLDYKTPMLAFNLKGVFAQDLANYLGKKGIIVRSGLSCAKLMNQLLGTDSLVRASFYVYNSLEEIKEFIKVLKNLTKEEVLNEII